MADQPPKAKRKWDHPSPFNFGLTAILIGGATDLFWHLSHRGSFESALDQLQAHAAYWLGVTLLGVSSWRGMRKYPANIRRGYAVAFASCLGYLGVAVFHFIAHFYHREATTAHIATVVTGVSLVFGLTLVGRAARDHDDTSAYN